jgi:gamma-glutamyltranspeptidase/glutathione hydrolase
MGFGGKRGVHAARTVALSVAIIGAVAGVGAIATAQTEQGTDQKAERPRAMRPLLRGTDYAVSSMKAQATQVADRVLRAGGNAFDAIVAGQAALAIVDAASNGIGSDAMILVHEGRTGKVWSVNAEGTAPRLATIDWYKTHHEGKLPSSDTLLSGTVPGVVDAWYVLLERWGTLRFADVLAPAIELADKGFPISDGLARGIAGSKKLKKYPSSVRVYFPGGQPPPRGSVFRNRDAARTLRRLVEAEQENASKGRKEALRAARDRFYKGDIAREMARFSEENGGLFRYEDFASYSAKVEEPVWTDYRGYRMYKNPSANQGPSELLVLNLLEGYDLRKLGHNSADAIHVGVESVKLAFADREKYMGDDTFIRIPWAGLLSKEYASERRRLIDMAKASMELRPGVAEKHMTGFPTVNRPLDVALRDTGEDGDTSYIAVVDRERNAITFTPSLHSGFGTSVVMGELGFSFNCRGDYFSLVPGHANALEPGKRPRSTLQSTLVTKDGKFFLVTGSPGGDDQCMRTLQTFLNIVEYDMNVQQAIEAPRWSTRSFPMSYFPHAMYTGEVSLEARVADPVRQELERRGHKLKSSGAWSLGSNAAIMLDAANGVLQAGADPRADAYALAW